MEEYTSIEYDGKMFMEIQDYDEMLRVRYGDYMKLPPIEEQVCKHKPEIVIF